MFTNTKIAFAVALVIGAASAALANDIDTSPSTAQSEREWRDFQRQTTSQMGNAGSAYGYFASPTEQDLSGLRNKSHNH